MFARSLIKSLTLKTVQRIKGPNYKELFLLTSQQNKKFTPFFLSSPKFSFSSEQNPLESEIESILNEMGKQGNQQFDEPFV